MNDNANKKRIQVANNTIKKVKLKERVLIHCNKQILLS